MDTKKLIRSLAVALAVLLAQLATAQAPTAAPAGATGLCNDGTYSKATSKRGACRGHKGVKEWYGASASSEKGAEASGGTSESAPASTAAPSSAAAQSAPAEKGSSKTGTRTSTRTPAPGGGPDKVWLNTATNVYHCPGTRYYGTTKAGEYMTEDEAKAKGAHPDHGKACK
jgi:Protein of unknown function (DUF3761)